MHTNATGNSLFYFFVFNYRVAMQPLFGNPEVTNLNKRARHLKISIRSERPRAAKQHKIQRHPSAARVSVPARATPQITHAQPTDLIRPKPTGKNKGSGTCVCKSDGSTNLSGRLRLGHGHGGLSHVPRRRVGEAPRHGRRATALYPRREITKIGGKAGLIDRESLEIDRFAASPPGNFGRGGIWFWRGG